MSDQPVQARKWSELGRSTTTPIEIKVRKEVTVDVYYVVVGFETNDPSAFTAGTHDLAIDYGHAFFYVVKNNVISKVFSFGPKSAGKVGWLGRGSSDTPNNFNTGAVLKDGFKNARPGTPDYAIPDEVKVFKLPLTARQGIVLEQETDKIRQRIISGKQKYTAYMNDTCAETARDILTASSISSPSGSGAVKHSGLVNVPIAYAVNPYMWHHNFVKAGHIEVRYPRQSRGLGFVSPSKGQETGVA
jgi:hypothetical protein